MPGNKKERPQLNALPTNRSLRCTSIKVHGAERIMQMVTESVMNKGQDIAQRFEECRKDIEPLIGARFVIMQNKPLFFDCITAAFFPALDNVKLPVTNTISNPSKKFKSPNFDGLDGVSFELMTYQECCAAFGKESNNPYRKKNGYVGLDRSSIRHQPVLTEEIDDDSRCHVIDLTDMSEKWWHDDDKIYILPICRLHEKDTKNPMKSGESLLTWMKFQLLPDGINKDIEVRYVLLQKMFPTVAKYLQVDTEDHIVLDSELFKKDAIEGILQEDDLNVPKILETIKSEKKYRLLSTTAIKKELCHCDEKRANIEPYDEGILTDVQRGHWELFELMADSATDSIEIPLDDELIAKPPHCDVGSGTCAIDFGTKSTVVVFRDGEARMLRIGKGELKKAPTREDYENPTVINLRDIKAFLKAYRERVGRPFTEWEQATVSHQAAESLKSPSDSIVYSSVFSELKQWAKEDNGWSVLRDMKGETWDIKPYLETAAMDDGNGGGDFDPIELYAYYLGLYINNMHRKICLDYILSFPVNYRKNVRERIRLSFEKGLRKSLPPSILQDEALMKRFRVYLGASEPAAYAVSALEQFGLQPTTQGEQVAYGVFDFGGGTTDFDFGVEYIPEDQRRNYVIEQFGFNGDILLGGENLLERLAYTVYKDNVDTMREHNIPFFLPPDCDEFAGSETLVSRSNDADARMNIRILAEKLRPIWEQTENAEAYKELTGDAVSVDLFQRGKESVNTQEKINLHLKIDAAKLEKCLEDRIRQGVDSFFQSMHTAFKGRTGFSSNTIHIFLAGNSCRSPIVIKLFNEYIEHEKDELRKSAAQEKGREMSAAEALKLYPPLDMAQKNEDTNTNSKKAASLSVTGINTTVDMEFDRRRTGKTGVAFGLLRCRRGGKDVQIINRNVDETDEMLFPYYLGKIIGNQNFEVTIGKDVAYGTWAYYTTADESEFEIYYTPDPMALQGNLPVEKVSRLRCFLEDSEVNDTTEKDFGIYIRKVDPYTVDYAVGRKADFESSPLQNINVHHQKL